MRHVAVALVLASTATVSAFRVENSSLTPQRGESQSPPRLLHTCLLVDVHDEGFSATSAAEGVAFDIDGDGVTERVAWPKPGSRLGFLALDVNGNGSIDSGAELLGSSLKHPSVTRRSSGISVILLLQGAAYDAAGQIGPSSALGKSPALEPDDAVFQKLVIWRDSDRNGRSTPSELSNLQANRILAVSPGATVVNRQVPGAMLRFEGAVNTAFEAAADRTGQAGRKMYEVALDQTPPRR